METMIIQIIIEKKSKKLINIFTMNKKDFNKKIPVNILYPSSDSVLTFISEIDKNSHDYLINEFNQL